MTLLEELRDRLRMLEAVVATRGQLHDAGVRQLIETLERCLRVVEAA